MNALKLKKDEGFVALFLIVLIGSAALVLAYNSAFLGLGDLDAGFSAGEGKAAFLFADGCLEETLERIRRDPDYGVGQGEILLSSSGGSCIIRIENPGGSVRNIRITGARGEYTARIEVDISIMPEGIVITSWKEG